MKLPEFPRLIRTLRFLKLRQVFYQIYYRLAGKPAYAEYKGECPAVDTNKYKTLVFHQSKYKRVSVLEDSVVFSFLNKEKIFSRNEINWNTTEYGKLWTYHLNYFEFLVDCDFNEGRAFIESYFKNASALIDGMEPYPTSLRILNWIKFAVKFDYREEQFLRFICADIQRLRGRLEYHLLANHLLENLCALWVAACFFDDETLKREVSKKLEIELKEQFNQDGLHYERSPMYHAVLLTRLLDCYIMGKENNPDTELMKVLHAKLSTGAGRLKWFTVKNTIPEFNDATNEETPNLDKFFQLLSECGIGFDVNDFADSGFYKIEQNEMVVFADYGNIQPSYQPGHAHAGTLGFVLFYHENPVIVDTGISTYTIGERRSKERSTMAHNTITYANTNSSEVWSGFRVGRRANVHGLEKKDNLIKARHDGYRHLKAKHYRAIQLIKGEMVVDDLIEEKYPKSKISRIHFHPEVKIERDNHSIILNNHIQLTWSGVDSWELNTYDYTLGYNKFVSAYVWEGNVQQHSKLMFKTI